MKHRQWKTPAYACGDGSTYHNEEWHYALVGSDGRMALVLKVGSGRYAHGTPTGPNWRTTPEGYSLDLHVSFPTSREDVLHGEPKQECDLVLGGRCVSAGSSCTNASKLVREHFDVAAGYEQPQSFWDELAATFAVWTRNVKDASAEWARCPHCDATGTVRR